MPTVTIELPEDIAKAAKSAGLLESRHLALILKDALRNKAAQEILEYSEELRRDGITLMSEDEIMAEVKAARAENRMAKQ